MWYSVKKRSKSKVRKIRQDKKADLTTSADEDTTLVQGVKNHQWDQQITKSVFENYNVSSLSNAKANWYFGEWQSLADINLNSLTKHPDVAKLAALKAAGYQQLNDLENCKKYVAIARTLGCDNRSITKLLIAGVHNSLGKLSALKQDDDKAIYHFNASIDIGEQRQNTKLASQARTVKEISKLGLLSQAAKIVDAEINDLTLSATYNLNVSTVNAIKDHQSILQRQLSDKSFKLITKNDTDLIVVGTIPRSGSTWIFNCVKLLLEFKFQNVYSCWIEDYLPETVADIHLVKVHKPDIELVKKAKCVVSSRRDIRDVAASLKRMGWAESDESLLKQLNWVVNNVHRFWNNCSQFEVDYLNIKKMPEFMIEQLAHLLGVSCSPSTAKGIATKLNLLKNPKEYDANTQMHPEHRGGEYDKSKYISKEIDQAIGIAFSDWLKNYGYI
jgi:hypothetical protein